MTDFKFAVIYTASTSHPCVLIEACKAFDGAGADASAKGQTVWVIMDTEQPAPPLGSEFAKALMQRA